jgi:hypothetical protein
MPPVDEPVDWPFWKVTEGLFLAGSSYTHRWKSHLSYGRFVASTGLSPQ